MRRAGRARRERRKRPWWQELLVMVLVALVLAWGIKTFFVQAFSIPSGSMENTLQVGDRVMVDKFTPWFGATPERGDVVVFHDPNEWLRDQPQPKQNGLQTALSFVGLAPAASEKDLVKRVIAVGGDTVDCERNQPVRVNGVALDEPYLHPGATPCNRHPVGKVTVPKGMLWVMGDNRENSEDSRFHMDEAIGGFVPVKDVIGRAFVVAWPLTHWRTLPVPGTFDQPGLKGSH
nr:signal peptidase I [Streptomyces tateyamensis]